MHIFLFLNFFFRVIPYLYFGFDFYTSCKEINELLVIFYIFHVFNGTDLTVAFAKVDWKSRTLFVSHIVHTTDHVIKPAHDGERHISKITIA